MGLLCSPITYVHEDSVRESFNVFTFSCRSPPESTVIHDPLSRPSFSRSSHSHPPTSPSSLHSSTVTHTPLTPVTTTDDRHTYHHLRQHEGMELLPADYPENEYSCLGPRSETPPLRPPKPPQLQNTRLRSHSDSKDPPISATAPSWGSVETPSHIQPPQRGTPTATSIEHSTSFSPKESASSGLELDEVPRRSIYDTMEDVSAPDQSEITTNSGRKVEYYILEPSSNPTGTGDYDRLAMSAPRKHPKTNVKIFDDPEYLQQDVSEKRTRSNSVKVVDPRYVGDYERHPEYALPQIDIPRAQLEQKYHGDYERDPTYFMKRSFSTSASASHAVSQDHDHRKTSLNYDPRFNKYRGNYERSEDYILPPLQNGEIKTKDYTLEPDPNYMGAYERHPNYIPPLVRRPSKSKVQILSKDAAGPSLTIDVTPSFLPHEYTSLADVTKDPPRQYASLNSDVSATHSLPSDSTV